MTKEEIHNIYLHMSGKAEGIAEAMGTADFPVLFANAILEYAKRPWQGLTEDEAFACKGRNYFDTYKAIEQTLKERNRD